MLPTADNSYSCSVGRDHLFISGFQSDSSRIQLDPVTFYEDDIQPSFLRFLMLFDKASPELPVKTEKNYTRQNSTKYLQEFTTQIKTGNKQFREFANIRKFRPDPDPAQRWDIYYFLNATRTIRTGIGYNTVTLISNLKQVLLIECFEFVHFKNVCSWIRNKSSRSNTP